MDGRIVRRMFATACGLALVCLPSRAQEAGASYWPMGVGSTWTQSVTANGQTTPIVMTVTKNSAVSGRGIEAAIEYRIEDQITQIEIYRLDATGLYRVASGKDGTSAIVPALPVIRHPVVSGDTWSWQGSITMGGTTFPGTADLSANGPEAVITPAGNFKAIRVHLELTMGDAKSGKVLITNDYWFAKGIGLIKQTMQFGQTAVNGVLTSYRMHK